MATVTLSAGVDETEPTLIPDDAMQDCDGAEYRVGEAGPFVARGRDQIGDVGSVTNRGAYEAGFDGSSGYVIVHEGNSLHSSIISTGLSFSLTDTLLSGSLPVVGAHYANRHYLAFNTSNRRIERVSALQGLTSFPIGMSRSTFAIGASATIGTTGNLTANIGLVYWVTEYDSVRGIESMTGSSVSGGTFTNVASVIVTATGSQANSRADQLRWYRSVDGGGFPDGGLLQTTAIGTTQITDTLSATGSKIVPEYGIVEIGGLPVERDEPPPVLSTIFGPFQDSLLGVNPDEPRNLKFTPAGYPDSWPSAYGIPLETSRRDEIVTGVVLSGRVGVFCNDSAHVIYRLPRDSDSIFAAGEMQEQITDAEGCMSRRGACTFSPPGASKLAAWVGRSAIWVSNLSGGESAPVPVTDKTDWEGRVSVANLSSCRLVDDATNRRIVFIYRRVTDTTHNTGVWYLDYQEFQQRGIRITYADHGPLADAVSIAAPGGLRRLCSVDSRSGNGQVYLEATQDADDSQLRDASGSVRFRIRTKEYMPAEPSGTMALGSARWMHDAGPARIEHRFYHNRRTQPEVKEMPDTTTRNASAVVLGKDLNSFSLEIESAGTTSYGVPWLDIEGLDTGPLGGREGA